jgi:putative endonuclease
MVTTRVTGNEGEVIAKKFLEKQGWKCVGQNIYTQYGEIDLIFQHRDQIIFVEVKFRKNQQYGSAQTAITQTKLKRIMTSASIFLHTHHLSHLPARIDLVAIDLINNKPTITHLKNISQ